MTIPPGARRALGSLAILVWLVAWIVGAAIVGDRIAGAPWPVLTAFYAVAGVAWVIPLRPLFRWMGGGSNPADRA
jgi:hypothetical protein